VIFQFKLLFVTRSGLVRQGLERKWGGSYEFGGVIAATRNVKRRVSMLWRIPAFRTSDSIRAGVCRVIIVKPTADGANDLIAILVVQR